MHSSNNNKHIDMEIDYNLNGKQWISKQQTNATKKREKKTKLSVKRLASGKWKKAYFISDRKKGNHKKKHETNNIYIGTLDRGKKGPFEIVDLHLLINYFFLSILGGKNWGRRTS